MNIPADVQNRRELGVAANVVRMRAQALNLLAGTLDKTFVEFVNVLSEVKGRIFTVGTGTNEFVARYVAWLFASSGTPSLFVSPEAFWDNSANYIFMPGDAVLFFSGGEEGYFLDEVILRASCREIPLFMITKAEGASPESFRRILKLPQAFFSSPEVPFASSLVQIALGDALAMALLRHRGSNIVESPEAGGGGGGRFRLVSEIMRKGTELPLLKADAVLSQARTLLRKHAPCAVGIVKKDRLIGAITDADFRRMGSRVELEAPVVKVMRVPAATLREDSSVAEALRLLRESRAPALFVLRERRPVGLVGPYDCLKV